MNRRAMTVGFITSCCLLLVDGALPNLQMFVFNGRVPVSNAIVKIALVWLISSYVFNKVNVSIPVNIFVPWMVLVFYLTFNTAYFVLVKGAGVDYILFSVFTYYGLLLLWPIIPSLFTEVNPKLVTAVIVGVFVPLAFIGIAQHALANPLVPVRSIDGRFWVNSWSFFGEVRAFSLFSLAARFGHLISLVAAIATASLLRRGVKARIGATLLIPLVVLAGYSTLTRAVYLEMLLSIIAVVILVGCSSRMRQVTKFLPIGMLLIGLGLTSLGVNFLGVADADGIQSLDTLSTRFSNWDKLGGAWIGTDLATALLGTGAIQNGRFEEGTGIVIDNTIIAIGYHIGLLGLGMVVGLIWKLWQTLHEVAVGQRTTLGVACAATFSLWIFRGLFDIIIVPYVLIAFLGIVGTQGRLAQSTLMKTAGGD